MGAILALMAVLAVVAVASMIWRATFGQEIAAKGRVPTGPLQRALNILKGKTVHLVFEPEQFRWHLVCVALQREIYRLFNEAEMPLVEENPELTIFISYNGHSSRELHSEANVRCQLADGQRYGPLDFEDVQLTGRYRTLADSSPSRPIAKAEGYAEQIIYNLAALLRDPTGNRKL